MNQSDTRVPTFRSINRLSKWLVNWTIAIIIVMVVNSIIVSANPVSSSDLSYSEMAFVTVLTSLVNLVIVIAAGIITLIWFYRASKNIHAFGAKGVSSPRMAVIWWFIPIVNLWKPYQVAQQIWKASNPQEILSNGNEWKKASSSNTIKIWWLLGILSILVSVSLQFFSPRQAHSFYSSILMKKGSQQLIMNNNYKS